MPHDAPDFPISPTTTFLLLILFMSMEAVLTLVAVGGSIAGTLGLMTDIAAWQSFCLGMLFLIFGGQGVLGMERVTIRQTAPLLTVAGFLFLQGHRHPALFGVGIILCVLMLVPASLASLARIRTSPAMGSVTSESPD